VIGVDPKSIAALLPVLLTANGKPDSEAHVNEVQVQRDEELRAGDIVMLPDGGMAAIEKIVGRDAYVIEWQKAIGRGPWIFPVSDLVSVS
jgi:hypothetical protein